MNEQKKGHPILAVVLAIIAIVIGLALGLLTGTLGGIIAGVLGVIAIVLGVLSRKGGKGVAGIVLGAIALIVALIMALIGNNIVPTLHKQAVENGNVPLIEKYTENNSFGFLGMLSRVTQNEDDTDAFIEELKAVTSND